MRFYRAAKNSTGPQSGDCCWDSWECFCWWRRHAWAALTRAQHSLPEDPSYSRFCSCKSVARAGPWGRSCSATGDREMHPFVIGGVQQLSTGLVLLVPSIFQLPSAHWTMRGMGAIVYLAIFGGILGYGCYALVISRLPLAIASIYTYINPVVAVFLGWWVYREHFGLREAGAMAVIFAGVAMVRRASFSAGSKSSRRPRRRERLTAYRTETHPADPAPGRKESAEDRCAWSVRLEKRTTSWPSGRACSA